MLDGRRLPILPGSSYLPGTHHPHCDRHSGHLLWIFGRPLCLGCTCVAIGVSIGVLFLFLGRSLLGVGLPGWLALHAALVAPTAIQPWLQLKPFKVAARTLLGGASATWLLGGLVRQHLSTSLPLELAASALVFATLARALLWLRDAKTVSPCISCPLGAYPTCSWNLPRVLNGVDDADLARALMAAVNGGAVVRLPETRS